MHPKKSRDAAMLVALYFLYAFALIDCQIQDTPGQDLSVNISTNQQNRKPAAPYAIEDESNKLATNQSESATKSIIFCLTLNETGPSLQEFLSSDPLLPTRANETILNQSNLDLERLLATLNGNNFTSEIQFDDQNHQSGTLNITISSSDPDQLCSLKELIAESRSLSSNGSLSVFRDNHRFLSSYPTRSRPSVELPSIANTVPPIRRTHDVLAENYTIRKIADEANIFAIKLLNQLNMEKSGSHNVIQSPFAVYQGLALLLTGAHGDTSRELDRVLLGSQSVYENTKLTHDQDRARLMASFSDVVLQLYKSATSHFSRPIASCACTTAESCAPECPTNALESALYDGGTDEQHLIIANHLLFSPASFEISAEFKHSIGAYYKNTAVTKIETGSTESVQVVNDWIRRATMGLIPSILRKTQTFDEFNTMTLLSTSWLTQKWHDSFRKVASAVRSSIRLKGQSVGLPRGKRANRFERIAAAEPLLEFIDDLKSSHFVEYIKSEPTRDIHHYNTVINGQLVDLVVVKFCDSNQRFVALTPMDPPPQVLQQHSPTATAQALVTGQLASLLMMANQSLIASDQSDTLSLNLPRASPLDELPDGSPLTKLVATITSNPRRALRALWSTIAPEILTKQSYQNMQIALKQQQAGNLSSKFALPPLVRLSLPLIRDQADASLTASLNHIGIVNTFEPAQANLIGINGHPFNYHKLHLTNVIYKTTFNLNEYGVNYDRTVRTLEAMRISPQIKRDQLKREPGNVRGQEILDKSELIDEVRLNKPFVYMICDIKTRLILYTGVVRNPAKEISI